MNPMTREVGAVRRWLWLGLGVIAVSGFATPGLAQNGFRPTDRDYRRGGHVPSLSECTALLESAVRTMYQEIEPNNDTPPAELVAYADLRALRLYVGALEVAGWSLEQCSGDYRRYDNDGMYRYGRNRISDPQALAIWERYQAHRETVRTLLLRVRQTAVAVEHQVSFCDPQIAQEWQHNVLPVLRDTIAATEPMFQEEIAYRSYGPPGQQSNRIVQVSGTSIPREAVDVSKSRSYAPYDGKGVGQGRYFEVRAFGGAVHVHTIRFVSSENSHSAYGSSRTREIKVDAVAKPGQPLFIPCNRGRWSTVSDLTIEWDNGDRSRRAYGLIELVENNPTDDRRN
jgi:hypothetical protein